MRPRRWTGRLRCLNCGSVVHWTHFQCDICGQNPRENERVTDMFRYKQSTISEITDRRKYPRYDVQGKVILNRLFRGELVDLCQRGAKLKTLQQLLRDEVVHLAFAINGIPIQVKARVVHVKKGVIDERFTLGVSFEDIPTDQSEILIHHLEKIAKENPRPRYSA